MNCCIKCFNDTEIIDIIKNRKTKGNCDICDSKNINIYSLEDNSTLSELFDELLDIYTTTVDLPKNFPKEKTDLLKNIFYNNWSIFNLKPEKIYRLLTIICNSKYKDQPELFDSPVGIAEIQNKDYLEKNSFLKNYSLHDFTTSIKCTNRFHTNHINKAVFQSFLKCAKKTYRAGKIFYRARICLDKNG